jgi:hypothetical protein
VSQLQLERKVHFGFPPSGKPGVLEATPLMVGELLYSGRSYSGPSPPDPNNRIVDAPT